VNRLSQSAVLCTLIFLLSAGWSATAWADPSHLGVTLPRNSRQTPDEPDRWVSGKSFTETVGHFRKVLGAREGIRIYQIVALPRVQAVHVENGSSQFGWTGINISQIDDRVYIFFIRRR